MSVSRLAIKGVNKHIVIDDEQSLLIDTGSPLSFHKSGAICFGEAEISVPTSLMGVTNEYLTQKVGAEVNGIIGLDIINKYPMFINLKDNILCIDDAKYTNKLSQADYNPVMRGLFAIETKINNQDARMLIDTGAKISYISSKYVSDLEEIGVADDFSPYIGDFKTKLYSCKVDLLIENKTIIASYAQNFGNMPSVISMILNQLNLDGIVGFDLFEKYQLQLNNGMVFFPPQGI